MGLKSSVIYFARPRCKYECNSKWWNIQIDQSSPDNWRHIRSRLTRSVLHLVLPQDLHLLLALTQVIAASLHLLLAFITHLLLVVVTHRLLAVVVTKKTFSSPLPFHDGPGQVDIGNPAHVSTSRSISITKFHFSQGTPYWL